MGVLPAVCGLARAAGASRVVSRTRHGANGARTPVGSGRARYFPAGLPAVSGKDLCPPGVSAAKDRLREPGDAAHTDHPGREAPAADAARMCGLPVRRTG